LVGTFYSFFGSLSARSYGSKGKERVKVANFKVGMLGKKDTLEKKIPRRLAFRNIV